MRAPLAHRFGVSPLGPKAMAAEALDMSAGVPGWRAGLIPFAKDTDDNYLVSGWPQNEEYTTSVREASRAPATPSCHCAQACLAALAGVQAPRSYRDTRYR